MKILTPLRYCAFRLSGGEEDSKCPRFASGVVEGMVFCQGHVDLVTKALDDEGIELVEDKVLKVKARGS